MARTSASSRPLTDHNEIRRWAEERGAHPACVSGTGDNNDVGMIRLDFPGYSGEGKLEEISWDEWFDKFDESGLALLVQDETARGQRSNFNKLVSRETAGVSGGSSRNSRTQKSRRRSSTENGDREMSAGYSEDDFESSGDDLESGVELEEVDLDVEQSQPARQSRAGSSRGHKRQSGAKRAATSRGSRSSSSVRGTSSQRGRSTQKTRSTSSKKGRTTAGARSRAKKAPARAASSASRTTRGRAGSGRKRAA